MKKVDWFKAGARIARTGGNNWTWRGCIHWTLSQGGYPADAKECAKGFLTERRLERKHGDRTGKPLGKESVS